MNESQNPAQGAHAAANTAVDLLNTWQQQYATNNTEGIPHDAVYGALRQLTNEVPVHQQQEAATHAFAQLSTQQRADVGTTILNLLHSNGLNPQDAGIHTTNPSQIGPQDLTRLTNYAEQQNPDLLRQLLSNPLVGMLISALLSYAIQRFMSGLSGSQGTTATYPAPAAPGLGGGGIGGIITTLLGGAQQSGAQAPGGGDLGGLITGLLGGQQGTTGQGGYSTQPTPQAPGGGLGGLITDFLGGGGQPQLDRSAAPSQLDSPDDTSSPTTGETTSGQVDSAIDIAREPPGTHGR